MKKIILGLAIVLGLSFCMAFGVVATDEDCPFPSRIHEGLQYQEPSQYQGTEDWLDISGGNLSYGMRSDNVMNLQQRLSQDPSIYPEGLTTGFFGELTQQAVKRFQTSQGLEQTGIVDEATRNFIYSSIKDISILTQPNPFYLPNATCDEKCRIRGWTYGICRSCAVYPGQKPCKEGEVSIGSTSDCSVEEVVDGGIVGIQVGIQKACCCGERQTDICTDSDGGINKYVKGTTCQPSRKISAIDEDAVSGSASLFCKTDRCQVNTVMNIPIGSGSHNIAEGMLTEYYCKDGVMMSKTIECIAGCEDGACIKEDMKSCFNDGGCSETQFCEFPGCAAETGICVEVTDICPMIYGPVCGCDNKTYSNDCTRRSAKVSKKYDGECGGQEQCAKQGDTPGSQGCCSGLVAKGAAKVGENGECLYMRHLECLKCGDNFCDSRYENKCNCPEDCKTTTPTVDVQPILTLIREAINKLNSAIRLLGGISPVNGGWAH